MSDYQLSKTMSHALRHAPWLYELEIDEEGWTAVEPFLLALRQHRQAWRNLSEADLQRVVQQSSKKRYEMADGRIRALYGHSLDGRIVKQTAVPPNILYHGTAPATAEIILREGLKPMSRQYVHLSADTEMAQQVGSRKDNAPLILCVHALQAHQAGFAFYKGNERVWLADSVPANYIKKLG